MKVYTEEVFGPVICINSYETIDDAIQQANNTKFGLQCGVFTSHIHFFCILKPLETCTEATNQSN